jgi:hypothetical protein
LSDCKAHIPHGQGLPWLQREFGWKEQTARNFMQVHELSAKSPNFGDLNLPVSGLYALAAPSTPDELQADVIERSANGETFTHAQIKDMIAQAREQDRAEAERKAAEQRAEYERQLREVRACERRAVS